MNTLLFFLLHYLGIWKLSMRINEQSGNKKSSKTIYSGIFVSLSTHTIFVWFFLCFFQDLQTLLFICCVCHTFCFHILLGNRVQILFFFALHMIMCDALKNRWTVLVISYICLSFLLRFFLISEKWIAKFFFDMTL